MTVMLRKQGRLARITLARPPLNILDLEHLELFGEIVGRVQEAAVLVIESSVPKAFSAGNDIADHAPSSAARMLSLFHTVIRGLLDTDAITIADISGECLGGGCEIVAACDLAYATPESHFAQPEIDVGCFPPVATSLLQRRIGAARAADMIFTGRRIDAHMAAAWGLVSGVHKQGAAPIIEILQNKSAPVLKAAKMAFRQAAAETPEGGITRSEQIYVDALLPLRDYAEGIRAFQEKRKPRWGDA